MGNRKNTEKLVFIAILVALSVVLGIIDKFISGFAANQGVRIGLANIVILTGLYYLKFNDALLLIILKSILSGFIYGTPMAFLIGLSGTVFSFFVMYYLIHYVRDKVSLVGVSMSGSITHNIGQIAVLVIFYGWGASFWLIWLIPLGIGTGIFVGYIVSLLRTYLDKGQVFKTITNPTSDLDLMDIIHDDCE